MKLPAPENALIAEEKIRSYLLSADHPIGRHKARFFRHLGFRHSNWRELLAALRRFSGMEVSNKIETEFGDKFEIRGRLAGPEGRAARVVTVWMVETGERHARFVTAYPEN